MSEVRRWLKFVGLQEYADLFAKNKIGFDILPDLSKEDLESLGIPLGDRKRILNAIARLHESGQSSLKDQPQNEAAGLPTLAWKTEEGKRRQLTVMFVDLVGSTRLSQRLDVELFSNVIKAFHSTCSKIIKEHRGWVAQYQGDGQLAYFGYPKAGEEDPELAVLAGLSIAHAVPKITTVVDGNLQARVGIATGLVVVGNQEGTVIPVQGAVWGDAANLGARLQGIAGPGEVIVSDDTRKIIGNQFICEDLGLQNFKGYSERLRAWRVRGAEATDSRFEAHQRGVLTPFLGRDEEVEILRRRWDRARQGEGQVVLICGEPGIGKSRLTRELIDHTVEEPVTRVLYQCSPNHTVSAYFPILMHLERAAGFAAADTPDQKLDKLERLIGQTLQNVSATTPLFALLLKIPFEDRYGPLELSPKQTKDQVLNALVNELFALAHDKTIVVVFEDIQWIDPTSQEFLDMLIAKINTYPVLLLCTYRPDVTAPWVGMAHVTALHLNRLERRQSTMIVQQLSGENDLPARITEEIVAKTDGVPLFLEELTKAVLESEVLQHPDQPRSLVAQPETWTMPATLKDSLMARLDRLTGVGEVATIGAAIGRTFSYDLLAAATELTDEDLQSALKKLIDAQLLFQRGQPPDATYTFKHSLVQDTAYESLLISKRRPLHLKIASAIQSSTSGIVDKKPEILALHFARANAHAEARDYWQRAAILASQASANSEAITHINNALIANESIEDNEERVSHEIHLRELLYVSQEATIWGSTEIVNNLERLKALKERRGDSENLLSVLHGLSGCHLIAGRVSDARSLANRLFEITNDSEKYAAAVLGNRLLGVCDLLSAEFDDAVLHFEKTIALSREIDQEKVRRYYHANNLLVSQSLMSWALVLLGEKDSAAKSISLSDQLIQAERDIYSRIYALSVLASACQSADNPKKSLKFAVLALELSQTHASPYWEAWAQILVGWGTATLGKPHEGIEKIRQGISGYQATGSLQLLPYAWTLLADAYCRTGKITKGLETIDQFEKAHAFKEIRYVDGMIADLRNRFTKLSA